MNRPPSIESVLELSRDTGTAVRPELADYDEATPGWRETEYRADTEDGTLMGYWTGQPGWVRIDSWPYREVCVILSGRVRIEDATGAYRDFGPGQAFTIPYGFSGRWHTLEPTDKIFVGIEHGQGSQYRGN